MGPGALVITLVATGAGLGAVMWPGAIEAYDFGKQWSGVGDIQCTSPDLG